MPHQHNFIISTEHDGYEVCTTCGTFHSLIAESPEKLYIEEDYWNGTSRNTPDHQYLNQIEIETCGISKADFIMQFVPRGEVALEIGCFPARVLQLLEEAGFSQVIGIEPALKYIPFINEKARRSQILCGFFPDVTKEFPDRCLDVIICCDVYEHSLDYDAFTKEAFRILRRGGKFIVMSPMLYEDGLFRKCDFIGIEHIHIFSKNFLDEYLKQIFHSVQWERWINGHETFIATK